VEAGADAILIHSKDKSLREIEAFLAEWQGDAPLVAVPTLFPDFTVEELHDKGFQMKIFFDDFSHHKCSQNRQCLQIINSAFWQHD